MTTKLDELLTKAIEWATNAFDGETELVPTWLGQDADDHMIIVATPFDAEVVSKDIAVLAVKSIFKDHKIVRYVFASEAWVVSRHRNDRSDVPPSEDPERKECIVFSGQGDGKSVQARIYIERPEGGHATLSSPEIDTDVVSAGGRLVNVLSGNLNS